LIDVVSEASLISRGAPPPLLKKRMWIGLNSVKQGDCSTHLEEEKDKDDQQTNTSFGLFDYNDWIIDISITTMCPTLGSGTNSQTVD